MAVDRSISPDAFSLNPFWLLSAITSTYLPWPKAASRRNARLGIWRLDIFSFLCVIFVLRKFLLWNASKSVWVEFLAISKGLEGLTDHVWKHWYCLAPVPATVWLKPRLLQSAFNAHWCSISIIWCSFFCCFQRETKKRCTFLSAREPVSACEFVCVCVSMENSVFHSPVSLLVRGIQTPRVWTACGAQVPPPPLTNTPAAVYHAGSGVEDCSLPVHMPSYQPTLSRAS